MLYLKREVKNNLRSVAVFTMMVSPFCYLQIKRDS